MNRLFRIVRFSSIGVFFVGIFTTLAGCSNEDQIRALILFLVLMLSGGGQTTPIEDAAAFTFDAGAGLSFNRVFGETVIDCTQGDFQSTLNNLQNGVMANPAAVDTTITAIRFCHLGIAEIHFQVIVVSGTPPNLTLKARSGTLIVKFSECPGDICTVHFSPGLPVSSTDRVGIHTLARPLGLWGARGETTAPLSWYFFTGDPAGTNTYTNTPGNRRFIDFGTP